MNPISRAALLLIASIAAGASLAQDYPSRPVRIVVPFSPGGSTDVLARIVGQKLTERSGQPVIIENRAGAGGNIGAEQVARSAPDGYTLLLGGVPHAISASLYSKLPYDLARDLAAIAEIASFPSAIVLHPSLPANSASELIALARARPGRLSFGSAGNGSPNHLSLELFQTMAGFRTMHVPYKGSGQLVGDLLAGQGQLASMGLPVAVPHVQSGKLRAVAVAGAAASSLLPEVPTVSEAALPGFEVTSWYGVFAPAGLPADIVAKLNCDIGSVVTPGLDKKRVPVLGGGGVLLTPDE